MKPNGMKGIPSQRAVVRALRHDPASLGIVLDSQGYVPVGELCRAIGTDRAGLEAIAARSGGRIVFSPDGSKVRAAHGHSVPVDYGPGETPPDVLYHGTATRFLDPIRATGLKPMSRAAVHLSESREAALRIGMRHAGGSASGTAVLEVDAKALAASGVPFHRSEDGVWLVPSVPPGFLKFPEGGGAR